VPVISPVLELSVRPAGSAGETVNPEAAPSVIALLGAIGWFTRYVAFLVTYAKGTGAGVTVAPSVTAVTPLFWVSYSSFTQPGLRAIADVRISSTLKWALRSDHRERPMKLFSRVPGAKIWVLLEL